MATLHRALTFITLGLLLRCLPRGLAFQNPGFVEEEEDLSFFLPQVAPVTRPQIEGVLARVTQLRDKAKESAEAGRAVAAALAAAMCTVPPIPLSRGLRSLKDGVPPEVQNYLPEALELLATIRGMGMAAPCLERPGVPRGPVGAHRYLVAAYLSDNEGVMPYWIVEVLRLGLLLQGNSQLMGTYFYNASTPEHQQGSIVHISVYESGSTDATPLWLEVADALWTAAGFRTFIVTNGSVTRETRLDPYSGKFYKQHRVQYMSSVKNAALEPLYGGMQGKYDYVLFLTDAFFCAPDMLRLSHLQADIACGLDFEIWIGDKQGRMPGVTKKSTGRVLLENPEGHAHIGLTGSANWHSAIKKMTQVHAEEARKLEEADARTLAARVKPRYEFYDTWVSRDVGGNPFIKSDPIARDTRTIETLHRGLPIPAKCCFNGAALINASYLHTGLRFRAGLVEDGECDISENSLLCEDFRRLGAKKVVVDPSVRVAYLAWSKDFHGRLPGGVGTKVAWSHVERSGALDKLRRMWSDTVGCMSVQCVPLRKGTEEVDIHNFRVIDLRAVNYTDVFLQRLVRPTPPPPEPTSCNLVMGPYGDATEGAAWDDLALSSWGKNPMSKISFRAGVVVAGLQITYGSEAAPYHGGPELGEPGEFAVQSGEYFIAVEVAYDEAAVHGLKFETNQGRAFSLGSFPADVNRAKGSPCPASASHRGHYRLISMAGTADNRLRSITFVWTPVA